MTPDAVRTTTLYRFFGADGALLYVGITCNPGRRFAEHASNKSRWSEIVGCTMEHFPSRYEAMVAEVAAIAAERPRYNIAPGGVPALVAAAPRPRPTSEDLALPVALPGVTDLSDLSPLDRLREASAQMDAHRAAVAALATIRADAVRELLAGGMTQADVARAMGVTPPAVAKLVRRT